MKRVLPLALILSAAQGIGVTPPAQPLLSGPTLATPHRCRVVAHSQPLRVLRIFKFLYVRLVPDCGPGGFAEIAFRNTVTGRRIPEGAQRWVLNANVPAAQLPPKFSRGGVWNRWEVVWYSDDGRAWPVPERRAP